MSELWKDLKYFWEKKFFCAGLLLVMVLGYATLLMNPTVGIDDTAFKVYFIDGVAPATGRWCLYLMQKVLPLDYNPYFVELVGLLVFCVSASLWCVLFYRVLGNRVSVWGYLFFAAVMISSPMLSELVVWYLQNGIYLGYGVTALALLVLLEAMKVDGDVDRVKVDGAAGRAKDWLLFGGKMALMCFLLTVALGFYESFMVVYLMGVGMLFVLVRASSCEKYEKKPIKWVACPVLTAGMALVLRNVIVRFLTVVFRLEGQYHVLESKDFSYVLRSVLGWFDGSRSPEEFLAVLKEFFVKYYLHAVVYTPVTILVLAVGVLVLWGIVQTVRMRDGWILGGDSALVLLPWIMPILEGMATYYRASQYVPVLTAFAGLIAAWEVRQLLRRLSDARRGVRRGVRSGWVRVVAVLTAGVLLYRQCYEMNKWLYLDAMKYEDDKRTLDALALELVAEYDVGKPICVVGNRLTLESLLQEVYTPTWSKKYKLVSVLVKAVDENVFEKYNTPLGYAAPETPQLSFINWASRAFFGYDRELIKFWKMHGFTFCEDANLDHYEQARELMKNGPVWPEKGAIVELEDHIIVNFGNY